eukprot:4469601-Prymnesium_polylepis.1
MKLTVLSEWWRVAAYMCYAVSFSLFPTILQQIPLSVAYATWSSVGTEDTHRHHHNPEDVDNLQRVRTKRPKFVSPNE